MTEKTLFIVKPDAVARNLVGDVVSRFERKGFKILKLKMFTFTQEQAEKFYDVHKDKPFFGELIAYITSGPIVAATPFSIIILHQTRLSFFFSVMHSLLAM